jgi:hypothetical protein
MARQFGNGMLGKVVSMLPLILSVFCTVYVIMDIVGKAGTSNQITQIGASAEEGKETAGRALQNSEAVRQQLSRQISTLETQDRKIESVVAEMSFQIKNAGINWIKNPKTGNEYCLIPHPLSWQLAQKWAQEHGGNLVMINDQAENDWLVKTFGGQTEYWIGMTDEKSEGNWFWIIGAPVQYFSWQKGEPDNFKKEQHFGITNSKGAGMWNDATATGPRIGIVERK